MARHLLIFLLACLHPAFSNATGFGSDLALLLQLDLNPSSFLCSFGCVLFVAVSVLVGYPVRPTADLFRPALVSFGKTRSFLSGLAQYLNGSLCGIVLPTQSHVPESVFLLRGSSNMFSQF